MALYCIDDRYGQGSPLDLSNFQVLDEALLFESETFIPQLNFFELQQVLELLGLDWSGTREKLKMRLMKLLRSHLLAVDTAVRKVFFHSGRTKKRDVGMYSLSPLHMQLCAAKTIGMPVFDIAESCDFPPPKEFPVEPVRNISTYDMTMPMARAYLKDHDSLDLPMYEPYLLCRFTSLNAATRSHEKPGVVYLSISGGPLMSTSVPRGKPGKDIVVRLCLQPVPINKVNIRWWPADKFACYSIYVTLMLRPTAKLMLDILKAKERLPFSETRDRIVSYFDGGEQWASHSVSNILTIQLLCPMDGARLQLPCRSIACNHFQCFDAWVYLLANERRPIWRCPVCEEDAPLDTLLIDEYFTKVLREIRAMHYPDNNFSVIPNGEWRLYNTKRPASLPKAPRKPGPMKSLPPPFATTIQAVASEGPLFQEVAVKRKTPARINYDSPPGYQDLNGCMISIYMSWRNNKPYTSMESVTRKDFQSVGKYC